jgi:hypothetical protein
MNRHALKLERRIRIWIAQQEMDVSSRREGKGGQGPRSATPAVRMPPALDLPDRERWRY